MLAPHIVGEIEQAIIKAGGVNRLEDVIDKIKDERKRIILRSRLLLYLKEWYGINPR